MQVKKLEGEKKKVESDYNATNSRIQVNGDDNYDTDDDDNDDDGNGDGNGDDDDCGANDDDGDVADDGNDGKDDCDADDDDGNDDCCDAGGRGDKQPACEQHQETRAGLGL